MGNLHVNRPEVTSVQIRIRRKGKQKFEPVVFDFWKNALDYGVSEYKKNFKIYKQFTYEWYEPLNIELVSVKDIP